MNKSHVIHGSPYNRFDAFEGETHIIYENICDIHVIDVYKMYINFSLRFTEPILQISFIYQSIKSLL